MLYVTTKSEKITYTAPSVMENATAPDGGLFVPMKLPRYDGAALGEAMKLPFWDCVAEILNRFFPLRLRGCDLSTPELMEPELITMPYKIDLAQLWSKTKGNYRAYREAILTRMGCRTSQPESWCVVAADIGMLFALYGKLCRLGILKLGEPINPVMASVQLSFASAVMYAGEMGLPVGETVLVCNENGLPWELLHRGEVRLDGEVTSTQLPLLDVAIPSNLERLIFCKLGEEGLLSYEKAKERRGIYALTPEEQDLLRGNFSVSVVGSGRGEVLLPRIYKNSHCLLSPYTALVYGGLMDHRSRQSEGLRALLLAEESPMQWGEAVLKALRTPVQSVTAQIAALEREAALKRRED